MADASIETLPLLAPGGQDDTAALQALNGKSARLDTGTFLVSKKITWGPETHIFGAGIDSTVIQLQSNVNDSVIELADAASSSIQDLTIDGNRKNNAGTQSGVYASGVLVKTAMDSTGSSYFLNLENLRVTQCANNGLSLLGRNEANKIGWNWVFHFNNLYLSECGNYCFYDASTDNCFSNFWVSGGDRADMYCESSSNMYVNFKCDGSGGSLSSGLQSATDGANVILNKTSNLRFQNMDCQSAAYVGMKVVASSKIYIDGDFNNNGVAYGTNHPDDKLGVGLYLIASSGITGDCVFYNVNPGIQNRDLIIDKDCRSISIQTEAINTLVNSGYDCYVGSLQELSAQIEKTGTNLSGFLDAYTGSAAKLNGYTHAYTAGLTAKYLALWLDGLGFPTSQNVWPDQSGNLNSPTPSGFAFTTKSGNNGKGGVVFNSDNDDVTSLNTAGIALLHFQDQMTIEVNLSCPVSAFANYTTLMGDYQGVTTGFWDIVYLNNSFYLRLRATDGTEYLFANYRPSYSKVETFTMAWSIQRIGTTLAVNSYKNGVLLGTQTRTATGTGAFNGKGAFRIRHQAASFTVYHVRVYNIALDGQEIAQNYSSGA